jgi:hypothetical protein
LSNLKGKLLLNYSARPQTSGQDRILKSTRKSMRLKSGKGGLAKFKN